MRQFGKWRQIDTARGDLALGMRIAAEEEVSVKPLFENDCEADLETWRFNLFAIIC
jgi:hypothetical protein